jgi:Tfp pilus assembly protein PilF
MAIDRTVTWALLAALLIGVHCAHQTVPGPDVSSVRPQSYDQAGRKLLREGRLQEAADRFQAALALDPDDVPALEGLGLVAIERRDWSGAEKFFRRGLKKDPTCASLFVGLGRVAAARGNDQTAIEHYRRAIELDDGLAEAYYRLALVYEKMGQFSLAEEYFKKTLDRDPNHSGAMEDWRELARRRSGPDDTPPEYFQIIKKPVVSRADLAALLARQLPLEKICDGKKRLVPPEDISGHWARQEISEVIACGMMSPYEDGTFRPRQAVTRRDCARIVRGILHNVGSEGRTEQRTAEATVALPDVPKDDMDLESIRLVTSLGIMELRDDGSFRPDEEVNGYVATKVVRALKEVLSR